MKNFLIFAALFIAAFSANAVELPDWIVLRLYGGITSPKYKFSDNFQDDFRAGNGIPYSYSSVKKRGFQGGFGVGFHNSSESFVAIVQPSFVRKGAAYTTNETAQYFGKSSTGKDSLFGIGFINFDETIDAVHIPLLLRWRLFGGENRFGMTVGTGFSFNYSIKGVNNSTHELESGTFPNNTKVLKLGNSRTDNYRALDVSALLHAGFYFKLNEEGTKRLTFSADWDMGLLNMQTDTRAGFLASQKLSTIGKKTQRSLGFQIGIEIWPDAF